MSAKEVELTQSLFQITQLIIDPHVVIAGARSDDTVVHVEIEDLGRVQQQKTIQLTGHDLAKIGRYTCRKLMHFVGSLGTISGKMLQSPGTFDHLPQSLRLDWLKQISNCVGVECGHRMFMEPGDEDD